MNTSIIARQSILWGIYLGLAIAVGTQILTWLGLGLTNWFVLMTYMMVILFIGLAMINFNKAADKNIEYVQAFLSVLMIIVISRLIFQFYMFVYTQYIEPDWVEKVAEIWSQNMSDSGVADEQIENSIETFRRSYQPLAMFTVEVIKYGIPQFILGCLVSVYFVLKFKREKNTQPA